jgi:hypothetical protein
MNNIIGAILLRQGHNDIASACSLSAIALSMNGGDSKEAYFNLNTAMRRCGNHQAAVDYTWRLIENETGLPRISCTVHHDGRLKYVEFQNDDSSLHNHSYENNALHNSSRDNINDMNSVHVAVVCVKVGNIKTPSY